MTVEESTEALQGGLPRLEDRVNHGVWRTHGTVRVETRGEAELGEGIWNLSGVGCSPPETQSSIAKTPDAKASSHGAGVLHLSQLARVLQPIEAGGSVM